MTLLTSHINGAWLPANPAAKRFQTINPANGEVLADVQAELEQLHPHDGREQNSLLWQQLSATAALLEPAHSALHGPSAAAAAPGNDSGNPSSQALEHSPDTEGGRQTAPQETPKAEPGNP